ncbi:MAG: sugar ABC transporter ATP-binding protein, partial [Candidatus Binatia bacterium]
EPLSNLDPTSRLKMRREILTFHRENRLTTIFVTHNLPDAIALGDRIAVMRAGQFEQVDTSENLMRYPANQYVADFFRASELKLSNSLTA